MPKKQKKPERIVLGVGYPWIQGYVWVKDHLSNSLVLSRDKDGRRPSTLRGFRSVKRESRYRLVLERVEGK